MIVGTCGQPHVSKGKPTTNLCESASQVTNPKVMLIAQGSMEALYKKAGFHGNLISTSEVHVEVTSGSTMKVDICGCVYNDTGTEILNCVYLTSKNKLFFDVSSIVY